MIAIRFLEDRGRRRKGQVVRYDEVSAAAIVDEGAAEYVEAPDAAAIEPSATDTAEVAVAEERARKARERAARRDTAAAEPPAAPPAESGD